MQVNPPENAGFAGARSPARKWRICRCTFTRPKIEDPQVRVRLPENGGSTGARSPAGKPRIRRCAFTLPKKEETQGCVRPPGKPRCRRRGQRVCLRLSHRVGRCCCCCCRGNHPVALRVSCARNAHSHVCYCRCRCRCHPHPTTSSPASGCCPRFHGTASGQNVATT